MAPKQGSQISEIDAGGLLKENNPFDYANDHTAGVTAKAAA